MTNSLKKYFNVKLTAPEKMVKISSHADHPYFNDVAVSKSTPINELMGVHTDSKKKKILK